MTRLIFTDKLRKLPVIPFLMGFTTKTKHLLQTTVALLMTIGIASISASAASVNVTVERSGNLGVIKGIVRDDGGSPISDASVAIFRAGTSKLLKQVTSASDGSFLAKILPGTYTILAVAQGFNPVTLFGVEISRSAEITYGFKLERAGSGNTLPEKRLDRNSSKWRIRAAQIQRSIYQNREGDAPVETDSTATAEADDADEGARNRKGQTVVETYFADTDRGSYAGVNFATLIPVGDATEVVIAGQTGKGDNAPERFETAFNFRPNPNHQLRLNTAAGYLGNVTSGNQEKALGQVSFQALDEWKFREGIILVFGFDYSHFLGAGNDSSLSPRLGLQFDLNAKTRLRTAFTTQTEEKTWAHSVDLEGQSIAFSEPVSVDDLVLVSGKPQMNKSRRLEFGLERILDNRSSIEANVFFDTTLGRGVGLNSLAFDTLGGDGFGEFVANQQGRSQGVRVVYTRRLNGIMTTSAGYALGSGQKLSAKAISESSNVFEGDFFQSFFGQLAADLKTGTSIMTIFRLSPRATVFAIDPFKGRLAIYDPGLSVYVTQSLPTLGLPFRAEAVVDARNIFDLQLGSSGDEGSLRLNAGRRMVRGGIQVRF
ncbi:MAG: carboxypeptidase regulatory-like domain-containing protein [Pyrinomonadaceae bacterium]